MNIISKLATLFVTLSSQGLDRDAYQLIAIAGYDEDFKDEIEEIARENKDRFNSIFGESLERLYFDFTDEHTIDDDKDSAVIGWLSERGFEVTNYTDGRGVVGGKNIKIVRFIDDEIKKLKEEQMDDGLDHIEAELFEAESVKKEYLNSNAKKGAKLAKKGKLEIVISRNPHDVAKMSTERAWKSCIEMGVGVHYKAMFDEVRSGGLAAYLISEDDKEVKKPIARIWIRRLESESKEFALFAEQKVYGKHSISFLKAVTSWVAEQNATAPSLNYSLSGSKRWSDTLDVDKTYNIEELTPETDESIAEKLANGTIDETILSTKLYHTFKPNQVFEVLLEPDSIMKYYRSTDIVKNKDIVVRAAFTATLKFIKEMTAATKLRILKMTELSTLDQEDKHTLIKKIINSLIVKNMKKQKVLNIMRGEISLESLEEKYQVNPNDIILNLIFDMKSEDENNTLLKENPKIRDNVIDIIANKKADTRGTRPMYMEALYDKVESQNVSLKEAANILNGSYPSKFLPKYVDIDDTITVLTNVANSVIKKPFDITTENVDAIKDVVKVNQKLLGTYASYIGRNASEELLNYFLDSLENYDQEYQDAARKAAKRAKSFFDKKKMIDM